jgi:segregation and condensation protein B
MEIGHIIPHIEALIFASDRPLTPVDITELINNAFGFMEDKITMEQVETSIEGIKEKYLSEFYPFELRESGGGWQFLTKKDFHKTVAQLNGEKFLKRLSNAALETLAIIAYKQPITKAEIESIRGVSSDYSIQKLLEKELIVITGRNEELPGKPLVYATSKNFMDYFGLNSPEDLPKLKEVFEEAMINPTTMTSEGTVPEAEDASEKLATDEHGIALVVTENGELLESPDQESNDQATLSDDTLTAPGSEAVQDESTDLPQEDEDSDISTPESSVDDINDVDSSENDQNNSSDTKDEDPESPGHGTSH